MKKLLKSLLLLGVAIVLSLVLLPLGIIWTMGEILLRLVFPSGRSAGKKGVGYLASIIHSVAVGLDQIGNSVCRDMFNACLMKSGGYRFGRRDETISSVLGKNQESGTLSKLGRGVVAVLDFLDPEHCKKSIQVFNSNR